MIEYKVIGCRRSIWRNRKQLVSGIHASLYLKVAHFPPLDKLCRTVVVSLLKKQQKAGSWPHSLSSLMVSAALQQGELGGVSRNEGDGV